LALLAIALLPRGYADASGAWTEFTGAGRVTAGLALWMAVWWMSEAIPVYATAMLPLALFPLCGAASLREAASPYGHELIFLFLGGFVLALCMQRWGLDRRIAFFSLRFLGSRPGPMILGFMAIAACLSMWVSNTATTLALYPVAISVLALVRPSLEPKDAGNLSNALLLGVAYAASIGGLGTLIGSPPNLILASFAKDQLGVEITFVRWMAMALPLVAVFLPLAWWILLRVFPVPSVRLEGMEGMVRQALRDLGPMGRGEKIIFAVFLCAVGAWIFRPLLVELSWGGFRPLAGLTDTGIGMFAAVSLFLIPAASNPRRAAMDWGAMEKLPFGVLLLFGGGLSLAAAMQRNGVGEFLGGQLSGIHHFPEPVFVVLATLGVLFLTELTSNTATAATLLPVLAAVAQGAGWDPMKLLVPAALAASCAFMLPVATPPNAIAYASGHIDVANMARAGFWLNLLGVALITGTVYALLGLVGL
jgi:sodium-dependent dicarboxylate transporter 2/3/5